MSVCMHVNVRVDDKRVLVIKGQFTRSGFAATLVQSCKRRACTCKLGLFTADLQADQLELNLFQSVDVTDQFKESRNGKQNM